MDRNGYVLFWSLFFVFNVVGLMGIIVCLALIARCLRELVLVLKKKPFSFLGFKQ